MNFKFKTRCMLLAAMIYGSVGQLLGIEPQREGPWVIERNKEGTAVYTTEMTIHPQAEPNPALKHRLIPDRFELLDGNSAIYYLKAMGFLEQSHSTNKLQEFRMNSRKLAEEKGIDIQQTPPYSWASLAPEELPLEDVKRYLSYTAFQSPLIAEATRRSGFSLDRNIQDVDNPIGILLPEIQTMRELARTQRLRTRVAIAEDRTEDAVTILKQQFTMARHLSTDEFIVSNFVGIAILGMAMDDMVHLLQIPDTPNLYWALATLPTPIVDLQQSLPYERNLLWMQFKGIQDVDENTRTAGYWQNFIDRVLTQAKDSELFEMQGFSDDPQIERAAFVSSIAAAYPGAKRYLIEECQMERTKLDALPTTQVVFLAAIRFHQYQVDQHFKWFNLPYSQTKVNGEFKSLEERLSASSLRLGWSSAPTLLFLPAIQQVLSAQQRVQQQIGLMQTIEAIRMYGAANDGKLPPSLDALPFPAPNDPFTGKPFIYEVNESTAMLSGSPTTTYESGIQYRFKLVFAK